MTLRELTAGGAPDVEIAGLAYSTEDVRPGSLFFCVRGFRADGHDFAPEAVERGAAALVCERPLGLGVPEVIVPNVRAAMAAPSSTPSRRRASSSRRSRRGWTAARSRSSGSSGRPSRSIFDPWGLTPISLGNPPAVAQSARASDCGSEDGGSNPAPGTNQARSITWVWLSPAERRSPKPRQRRFESCHPCQ